MDFAQLGLSPLLLRALSQEGYTTPTPIQAKAIPVVLGGRDVLGCAQTGTGKTAAFALPILHSLLAEPFDRPRHGGRLARVLILAPTRELACQIADSFKTYGRETRVCGTVIYGGVGQGAQVRDLKRGVDVIVATPGRLIDLMEQGYVDLSSIRTLVLDEADRMLDMGFIHPIRRIAAQTPEDRQTLLFSATMSKEIRALAQSLLNDPAQIAVDPVASAAPKIEQSLYMVSKHDKQAMLGHVLGDAAASRVVVFTKTKHGADRVAERLHRAGVTALAIHGNKAQNARTRALEAFRSGRARVLVATDVAARGLDVDDITHVVNFDLPMEPEAYVHRIGRTGRAGATGIAISFCDGAERDLLRDIERLIKGKIPLVRTPVLERAAAGTEGDGSPGGRPGRGPVFREVKPSKPPHASGHKDHAPSHHHADRRATRAGGAGRAGLPVGGEMQAAGSGPRSGGQKAGVRSFNAHNRRTSRR